MPYYEIKRRLRLADSYEKEKFKLKDEREVFDKIFAENFWNGGQKRESASGPGSSLSRTVKIREFLPVLWEKYNIKTVLDAPCGDFNWMKEVDKKDIIYIGGDIVKSVIDENIKKYQQENITFKVLDITKDILPKVDMILCKDCLQHLSYENVKKSLMNFKQSGSKYLLVTTYPLTKKNWDILDGDYPTKGISIDCSNVSINPNLVDRKFNLDVKSVIKLGTIGGLDVKYKGYDQVLLMMKKLKKEGKNNIEYHLVGYGDYKWIEDIALKNGIKDKIIIHGPLSHDKIFSFLDNIDIYIQPSLTEGMPRALLEAMSRACPCIGSNVGGIPELLAPSVIYKKKNIKNLTDIFTNFSAEKMKEQSQRNYIKSLEFSSEKLANKREDFLMRFKKSFEG